MTRLSIHYVMNSPNLSTKNGNYIFNKNGNIPSLWYVRTNKSIVNESSVCTRRPFKSRNHRRKARYQW